MRRSSREFELAQADHQLQHHSPQEAHAFAVSDELGPAAQLHLPREALRFGFAKHPKP